MIRPRNLLLLSVAVIAAGVGVYVWRTMPSSAVSAAAATSEPAPAQTEAAGENPLTLETTVDATKVFRRAFWRNPAAGDRLLQAERREWNDPDGVAKWQWFLVLDPGPETLQWLETNPFRLAPIEAGSVKVGGETPPDWLPQSIEAAQGWRSPSGTHLILIEASTGKVFATDQGLGLSPGRE